jgi:LysR family hydrogen peroxide-inducible transcriptional activator
MKITLRQLAYFRALATARNFGRAAEMMNVSQPALSMQIKELEGILGVDLVERLPRDVRLTRAGREVLDRATRVLAEAHELEATARLQGLQGALTLGIIPTIAPYLLPGALARLRAADISRDLRLREAQTASLLADLRDGGLDAIVLADPAPAPDLVGVPVSQDSFVLAGSKARLDSLPADLRPDGLNPDTVLLLDDGHCLADQARAVCELGRHRGRLDLGASSLSTLCGLVGQGFGVTLLPEIALPAEMRGAADLALRRFGTPEPARALVLLRRATSEGGAWFDDLATHLRSAAQELSEQARAICP